MWRRRSSGLGWSRAWTSTATWLTSTCSVARSRQRRRTVRRNYLESIGHLPMSHAKCSCILVVGSFCLPRLRGSSPTGFASRLSARRRRYVPIRANLAWHPSEVSWRTIDHALSNILGPRWHCCAVSTTIMIVRIYFTHFCIRRLSVPYTRLNTSATICVWYIV
jgi:hypothetical protein